MKQTLLITVLLFTSMVGFGQSYLGWITKQVNFRTGPSTEDSILLTLKPGTQIFIISTTTENDYVNIIDIATDKVGYAHKSFIKIGREVKKNEQGIFIPTGETQQYNPEIEIYNNTKLTLTLKLNEETHYLSPQAKKKITLVPGACSYRASAPNVIPNIGTEYMESNHGYTWQFYIVTRNR